MIFLFDFGGFTGHLCSFGHSSSNINVFFYWTVPDYIMITFNLKIVHGDMITRNFKKSTSDQCNAHFKTYGFVFQLPNGAAKMGHSTYQQSTMKRLQ